MGKVGKTTLQEAHPELAFYVVKPWQTFTFWGRRAPVTVGHFKY